MRAVSVIILGLVLVFCSQFYILNRAIRSGEDRRTLRTSNDETLKARIEELLVAIQERDVHIEILQQELRDYRKNLQQKESVKYVAQHANTTSTAGTKQAFPHGMSSFLHGVSRIRKDDFLETFDYGLPEVTDVERETGQSEVLLLYNTESAVPSIKLSSNEGFAGPLLSVKDATNKCETLNIVSIGRSEEASKMFLGSQCLALVGHEQMYHVQRFVKDDGGFGLVQRETVKKKKTLEYAGQYSFESDENPVSPARMHRDFLAKYLPYIDTLKDRLKPVLEKTATNNTVVVMVCNKDQSSLLHNFACACRAKGIQTENVVVFPTDKETEDLAMSLGFATFFDEEIFGREADAKYKTIVLRKVVACHLVNLLGYDLLFQDVDIVWYKNPLKLFHDSKHPLSKFDIMFADDGARWVMTFPYSANTGFFYARQNERTRHLFRSWLFSLDILYATNGDQPVMKTILPEESSLTGLRVKVLSGEEFPCGNRINMPQHQDFIQDVMHQRRNNTYMLHVNWNHGEKYKRGLMKQMGMWYVRDMTSCVGSYEGEAYSFLKDCCSSEPLVSCHIPDKPSLIPCDTEDWKES